MEKEKARALKEAASVFASIGKALLLFTALQWFFAGADTRRLYAAFRKLQIMVHLVITSVMAPANAMIFFSGIWHLVCYQIIDLVPAMRSMFGLVDREPFNQNFHSLGYQSVFFTLNINNLWLVIGFQVMALLYLAATRNNLHPKIRWLREKLHPFMIWNAVLSFIDNTLIILAVSCLMQYKYFGFSGFYEGMSTIWSLFFGTVILVSAGVNMAVMLKLELQFKLFGFSAQQRFVAVYEDLRYKRSDSRGLLFQPFWS